MKLHVFFVTFILCLQKCALVQGSWQTAYYKLVSDLFTNYRRTVRPSHTGMVTGVYIAFDLLSVQNIDEKEQVLESFASLKMYWYDSFLAWNASDYENIDYIFYPQKEIWLPDVVCANSVDRQVLLGYNELPCRIFNNGLVTWNPTELFRTSCDIDVTYYPFDKQVCTIILSTALSTYRDLRANADKVLLDRYTPGGTWELVKSSLSSANDVDNRSRLKVTLVLRRLRTFYILNIILPVMFLSLVASTAFYLPADAGEKMGLSMTILLAYAVYLTIISDNMPQTSLQVSYLAVYLNVLLAVTALAVLLSVLVLSIYHRSEEIPIGSNTARFTRTLRRLFGLCRIERPSKTKVYPMQSQETLQTDDGEGGVEDQQGGAYRRDNMKPRPLTNISASTTSSQESGQQEEELTWPKVSETLDRVFFISFSAFVALLTLFIVPFLALSS